MELFGKRVKRLTGCRIELREVVVEWNETKSATGMRRTEADLNKQRLRHSAREQLRFFTVFNKFFLMR